MHDFALEAITPDHLRAGLRISAASVGWTILASTIAIVLGASGGSLVLVAFGLTGLLDAAGSATLVVHFRHSLHHEAFSVRHERLALRVVTLGLFTIGSVTAIESARRLVSGTASPAVPAGVVVAAVSMAVLAVLAHRKRRIAGRIPSRALHADAWLSATGSLLALVAVAGTGLTSAFGWWWADAVAASVLACGAVVIAVAITRG